MILKNSIRAKIFIWIISLIIVFFLFSLIFTSYLFSPYYLSQQKKRLIETSEKIALLYLEGSDSLYLEIERAERMNGYQVAIFSEYEGFFYHSQRMPRIDNSPGHQAPPPPEPSKKNTYPPIISTTGNPGIVSNYSMQFKNEIENLDDQKYVFNTHYDEILKSTIINIFYRINDNEIIQLNRPLESIDQSIITANHFNLIAGIINLLLGTVAAYFIAKFFSKPINELKVIALSMSRLDFTHKYNVTSNDEIGELGGIINSLSDQLHNSISDLRKANSHLQEDIERERKIDEMRKEFIANVSHELRTPIALIKGYAEGLMDNVISDDENKIFYCEVINDEASKMEKHVSNLLELSQLQIGHLPLERTRFDVSELILFICAKYKNKFEEKDISCSFNPVGPIMVSADKVKTEQILINFLNNAINHVDEEKDIAIKISFTGNKKIRIQVRNSGLPIPKEDQYKIWDSYYKVDKARSRQYGGYGLGLSIVKAIQEQDRNDYGVENYPRGVIFWFELNPGQQLPSN